MDQFRVPALCSVTAILSLLRVSSGKCPVRPAFGRRCPYPVPRRKAQVRFSAVCFRASLPDTPLFASDAPDSILEAPVVCRRSGRPFKLTRTELKFYRDNTLPIPSLHPDERHLRRLRARNTRKLWPRNCGRCGTAVLSSYDPKRQELIYFEECYLEGLVWA
jgi:hypothetical protein